MCDSTKILNPDKSGQILLAGREKLRELGLTEQKPSSEDPQVRLQEQKNPIKSKETKEDSRKNTGSKVLTGRRDRYSPLSGTLAPLRSAAIVHWAGSRVFVQTTEDAKTSTGAPRSCSGSQGDGNAPGFSDDEVGVIMSKPMYVPTKIKGPFLGHWGLNSIMVDRIF